MNALLEAQFRRRTTEDWLDHLQGAVPCSPVHDIEQALQNPFVQNSDRIANFDGPGTSIDMLTGPLRVAGAQSPQRAGPALGADTDSLLQELGYSDTEIASLKDNGAV